jgi:hypothetical protein
VANYELAHRDNVILVLVYRDNVFLLDAAYDRLPRSHAMGMSSSDIKKATRRRALCYRRAVSRSGSSSP